MSSGILCALHIHPVESLAAYARDEAAVEPWGLDGDRRWRLIDAARAVVTQRQQPRPARISALVEGGAGRCEP